MGIEIRPCRSVEDVRDTLDGIGHYFGHENTLEEAERFTQRMDVGRVHAAWDGDRIVGGAGAFSFRMSVPGGDLPTAGISIVGVLPTHRRRGVLTALMRAQLADCRARGDAAAYLWASESTIYPRFGYGLAALAGEMTLSRERTAFALPFEPRGSFRLVDVEEAARVFPPLYEQQYAERPGMFTRSKAWWEGRRLIASPWGPQTAKRLALLELDGEPAGYAIYTVTQEWAHGSSVGNVTIVEAVAPTPEATRELWRWLLDFD
jgi:predicted acetyltransferase